MKKISTSKNTTRVQNAKVLQPTASTIDFIRQFARVYSFDSRLPASLGGLVNN
ncbi:hypothetical protein [Barnesiella intestinihominis]|uniref:hypothetical protein n=1 Tax=Barnesiella intestinihominis TaxID=487174 RepID=UPI0002EB6C00|nr:hypothetical protein [Barnesiella intestinihominis]